MVWSEWSGHGDLTASEKREGEASKLSEGSNGGNGRVGGGGATRARAAQWVGDPAQFLFCSEPDCRPEVETPIHDSIRELVTWECKEHGEKSWMCLQIRKEVLGIGIWIFEGFSNFTQIFEASVL
jgi:hypothetical protein